MVPFPLMIPVPLPIPIPLPMTEREFAAMSRRCGGAASASKPSDDAALFTTGVLDGTTRENEDGAVGEKIDGELGVERRLTTSLTQGDAKTINNNNNDDDNDANDNEKDEGEPVGSQQLSASSSTTEKDRNVEKTMASGNSDLQKIVKWKVVTKNEDAKRSAADDAENDEEMERSSSAGEEEEKEESGRRGEDIEAGDMEEDDIEDEDVDLNPEDEVDEDDTGSTLRHQKAKRKGIKVSGEAENDEMGEVELGHSVGKTFADEARSSPKKLPKSLIKIC